MPRFARATLFASLCSSAFVLTSTTASASVYYVRASASGSNNGSNWANAFTSPSSALLAAQSGDQIWVAAGTYEPARPGGLRSASFALKTGVSIYGGFAGTEWALSQRDITAHPTILSGDLNGDDSAARFDWTNHGENSYHVVTASNVGASARIDGFVITGGYADAVAPTDPHDGAGGGVVATGSSPTCVHLRIEDNYARNGGGVADANLKSSTVTQNQAQFGGGLHASVIRLEACRIFGNRATTEGSAVKLAFGNGSLIVNCLVYGNTGPGTAILGEYVGAHVIHCTVAYNLATNATCAGVADFGLSSGIIVRNSILWGNRGASGSLMDQQIGGSSSDWSAIEGFVQPNALHIGNADPRFRDARGADDVIGTSDDDYTLVLTSPCIDSGNNVYVPLGIAADASGLPRVVDEPLMLDTGPGPAPHVDRGAHESDGTNIPGLRPLKK
ncbi:MAG: right-handed parallel beta-helix repeat-containing protein [Planctomycetota bacterium]